MPNSAAFAGDILLEDTPDGGDIRIDDGLFAPGVYSTAIYLSLFGGNRDDSGKVENRQTWWGNTLAGVAKNEKLVSRLQAFIAAQPMTTKNILEAEECARLDLQWMIDEGVCDTIEASAIAAARNRLSLTIRLWANGARIAHDIFIAPWGADPRG